jgi:hypothetical protein
MNWYRESVRRQTNIIAAFRHARWLNEQARGATHGVLGGINGGGMRGMAHRASGAASIGRASTRGASTSAARRRRKRINRNINNGECEMAKRKPA